MPRVAVIGGGWAGCGAAVAAAKAGADEVILFEKTDLLLGTGLVGGIMRNNGRFTATEEMIALGAGDLFLASDAVARHKDLDFPGHKHASLYDVTKIEPAIMRVLRQHGVKVKMVSRVTDVALEEVPAPGGQAAGHWTLLGKRIPKPKMNKRIRAIQYYEKHGSDFGEPQWLEADVFIETTGSVGPQSECARYGNGCVMCIIRCPTFGGRVSIAELCRVPEMIGGSAEDELGAFSGSCKLVKESLAPHIVRDLEEKGVALVPLPVHMIEMDKLAKKACQQYASKEFAENIILLDTGHAKLMTSYFPLEKLRTVPGFENARYDDPYSGGIGNSVRYLAISPRDNALKVGGMVNLFCGGEKAGPMVGHTEAAITGSLAGHNAVRWARGLSLLELPTSLAVGDAIAHVNEMITQGGLFRKFTFSGAGYFQRMKEFGLYITDIEEIRSRVAATGLTGVLGQDVRKSAAAALAAAAGR
ncbi:MAG TPA: FAD-dependent oxidoreductase [Symbiobacteriaceae bacterium]|nr:FAD-dependent oxidoreductase [Symbiobacteriaceae bacterium]